MDMLPDPKSVLRDLRLTVLGRDIVRDWPSTLEQLMELLPTDDEIVSLSHVLVDHALSTLAYAIRALDAGSSQEVAWAARRAYEAADQAAISILGFVPTNSEEELHLHSHEIVQRELERQARDIEILLSDRLNAAVDKTLHSSEMEDFFTAEELDLVSRL